jgi:HD superfamily phosphohydrolase YqeK
VDEVRALAKENLDTALIQAVKNTILFLMKKNQRVYPDSFQTYNDLIMNQED